MALGIWVPGPRVLACLPRYPVLPPRDTEMSSWEWGSLQKQTAFYAAPSASETARRPRQIPQAAETESEKLDQPLDSTNAVHCLCERSPLLRWVVPHVCFLPRCLGREVRV